MKRLLVVGVGLIGGSLIKAVRRQGLVSEVLGIDPGWKNAQRVLGQQVDDLVDPSDPRADALFESADLIVLSMPVGVIQAELPRVLSFGVCVTDCGSTKREIVRAAAESGSAPHFVPGHPMAGFPEGGVEHADPELFAGRRWILCPEASSEQALRMVESLVRGVGATPVIMEAKAHDRAVALASHVPQVLASVLSATASEVGADAAAGPGFASATRVAGGAPEIWRDIFSSNADQVAWALGRVIDELDGIREQLAQTPPNMTAVMQLLQRARDAKRPR